MPLPSPPFISVVKPVRNEGRYLAATLRMLREQDYPSDCFEILVVDGQSTDDTCAITQAAAATPGPVVRVLENPGRLSSRARNIGVRAARGHWVLIVDGHVHIPGSGLLAASAQIIGATGARVLGRPQRLRAPPLSPLQEAIAEFRESRLGHSGNSYIFSSYEGWVDPGSVAVMYEKSLFDEVGFFDEQLDAAEDYEFNSRLAKAGLRCYTSPKLEVLYSPRSTLAGLFRQMQRYGLGQARLAKRDAANRARGGWIPALFVVAALSMLVGSVFDWRVASATLLCAVAYIAAVYAATRAYCGLNLVRLTRVVAVALTVHAGLGIGWWRGVLGKH
jgi:succinoglycan biosynthesis protein ExoA